MATGYRNRDFKSRKPSHIDSRRTSKGQEGPKKEIDL
jgi:hypothetical protein